MWKKIWEDIKADFKKNKKLTIACFILLVVVYVVLFNAIPKPDEPEEVTYPEFLEDLKEGRVDTVYYNKLQEDMEYTLFNEETKDMPKDLRKEYEYDIKDKRKTKYPDYDEFRKDILSTGTDISVYNKSSAIEIFYYVFQVLIPIIFIVVFFVYLKSTMQGVSQKDLIQTSDISFDDIIGHEEIIDDVKFITQLIMDPTKGDKIGAKTPKGLLFTGPPGTGKTLLAKAIAHEADVPFLYQNASGFVEMYVGLGAKRVRDLFKIARKNAPCILFIDEIDAIGGKRGNAKSHSENDQTINAILQEMDGFTSRDGIFIIAATNRPEELDDALVRSGRFDRQITVNPPKDWMVRRDLFEYYLGKFKVVDGLDIDNLSKQTSGFTGADIAMICNEASIIAVMKDKDAIDMDCIEEAIDKKVFKGNRAKKHSYEKDRVLVAYHESGHAVMSHLLGEPIARASIQSTISGVGGAVFNEDKETMFITETDMKHRVMICYAGRASEEIKFDDITTGASNDITQATQVMIQYIEHVGFDKEFGLLDVSVLGREHLINGDIITDKLSKMSIDIYNETYALLKANYGMVELLAQKLLDVETLSGSDILELFDGIEPVGTEGL